MKGANSFSLVSGIWTNGSPDIGSTTSLYFLVSTHFPSMKFIRRAGLAPESSSGCQGKMAPGLDVLTLFMCYTPHLYFVSCSCDWRCPTQSYACGSTDSLGGRKNGSLQLSGSRLGYP